MPIYTKEAFERTKITISVWKALTQYFITIKYRTEVCGKFNAETAAITKNKKHKSDGGEENIDECIWWIRSG